MRFLMNGHFKHASGIAWLVQPESSCIVQPEELCVGSPEGFPLGVGPVVNPSDLCGLLRPLPCRFRVLYSLYVPGRGWGSTQYPQLSRVSSPAVSSQHSQRWSLASQPLLVIPVFERT